MKFAVAVIALISFAALTSGAKVQKRYDYEYSQPQAYQEHQPSQQVVHVSSGSSSGKGGYSAGSGLRSIAQGSAAQANSAVVTQHAAGKQASYVAQNTLAQTAVQASATAQAALAGKKVLLQRLEQQNIEAHQALDAETQQLQLAQRATKAAQQSAQQSLSHVATLQSVLNTAQSSSDHAQQAASDAAAELGSQKAMVGKAKARIAVLDEQLHSAQVDFEATQAAAQKASQAAQAAQNVAAQAAAHAAESGLVAQAEHSISAGDFHEDDSKYHSIGY